MAHTAYIGKSADSDSYLHSAKPTLDNDLTRFALERRGCGATYGGRGGSEINLGHTVNNGDPKRAECVGRLLAASSLRKRFFGDNLFFDPAWELLLSIFAFDCMQKRATVMAVVEASQIPTTTVIRWLAILEDRRLIRTRHDPLDGRRRFIELTDIGDKAFGDYLGKLEI